jgi:hypothetical protein
MLKTVTITGADNSIDPLDLLELSNKYPFVEWGILLSKNQMGSYRFPSMSWMRRLKEMSADENLKISGHLCGGWVRSLLVGDHAFIKEELGDIWPMFKRIQINTHGFTHDYTDEGVINFLRNNRGKEFIFQYDGVNSKLLKVAYNNGFKNFSTLFDLSHGAGILPEEWPLPIEGIKCGYAGGIGPDNIIEQTEKIEVAAGDHDTWTDMETKVRSANNNQFDLKKVEECLSKSSPFIKEPIKE